jgi:2-keto-4-pentenoate hydratase/2-oxohepta-3-ene-1,7-dioic acid hydratase in catechol pathway
VVVARVVGADTAVLRRGDRIACGIEGLGEIETVIA